MPDSGLAGSRIRERRLDLGIRQAHLARDVGISPAYLNLIEHNRRSIGGKLLIAIADRLGVEPATLSTGAQSLMIETLTDAAIAHPDAGAEPETARQLAGRFPGWAELIAAQHRQIQVLLGTVEALSDRLTHDPGLAASMHEILSVVTAIRSTAGILSDGDALEPEWLARFHRNLREDAQRLAESVQELVDMLDSGAEAPASTALSLPQEDLETWLDDRGHFIAELEGADAVEPDSLLADAYWQSRTAAAQDHARAYLQRYRDDAQRLPMDRLARALGGDNPDPLVIAADAGVDLALVLRRMACMPRADGQAGAGLVCCDGSGVLTFRKQVDGFAVPSFGAACPLWPLFQALSRPMVPVPALLEQAGPRPQRFFALAIAQPQPGARLGEPQLFSATMLLLPDDPALALSRAAFSGERQVLPVGSNCRICPRADCAARRDPSILSQTGADTF